MNTSYGENARLDVGCGAQKIENAIGVDYRAFPGVDVVFDLNSSQPWPFPDDTFSYIHACHVIEHLHDTLRFFVEIHRVAKHGAIVHIETPHYSSRDSWIDPTHVKHFSLFFTSQSSMAACCPSIATSSCRTTCRWARRSRRFRSGFGSRYSATRPTSASWLGDGRPETSART